MSDVALGVNPLQRNIILYSVPLHAVAHYKETGTCILGYTLQHTCILPAGCFQKKSPQLLQ